MSRRKRRGAEERADSAVKAPVILAFNSELDQYVIPGDRVRMVTVGDLEFTLTFTPDGQGLTVRAGDAAIGITLTGFSDRIEVRGHPFSKSKAIPI